MVHGAVHLLFRVLGAVLFLLLISAGLLAWRLSEGPLPLDLLTPYIEDMIAVPDAPFLVRVGRARLLWERGDNELDLRLGNVRALDHDGIILADVAEIGVTLAPRALLRGAARLSSVEVIAPHLELSRDADGTLHFGLWSSKPAAQAGDAETGAPSDSDVVIGLLVDSLTTRRDGPLADLSAVRMVDATADIIDYQLGAHWRVPRADVELLRSAHSRIDISAQLDVALPDGPTRLTVTGGVHGPSGMVDADVIFAGLRPAALAPFAAALEPLAALDLSLQGTTTVVMQVHPRPKLHHATLEVTGGAGMLRLPAPLNTDYAVDGLSLRASATASAQTVLLDSLEILLARPEGAEANPVARASATAGPAENGGYVANLSFGVEGVPVDALSYLWPEPVAPHPREWVTERLSDGIVPHGRWSATLRGPTLDAVEVTEFSGLLRAEGVTVDYLPPMPKARNASADVSFGLDTITLAIDSGRVNGVGNTPLIVNRGAIAFHGLSGKDNDAVINLDISGGLKEALVLIDHEPLGYTSALGVSAAGASGQVRADLRLSFPLLAHLPLDLVKVEATADIRDAVLPDVVFGRDLTAGNLTLTTDTSALEARGQAHIGGVPAGFVWREVFNGTPYRSRYAVQAIIEEHRRGMFGLDFPPFVAPFLRGPMRADLDLTVVDATLSTMGVSLDLSDTELFIPGFDWTKPAGQPGQASLAVRMAGDIVREVPRFVVRAADTLIAEGGVTLHDDGTLDRITFSRFDLGETMLRGNVALTQDGTFDVHIQGPALDAVPFLGGPARGVDPVTARQRNDGDMNKDRNGEVGSLPPVRLRGAIDVVWLADTGSMEKVEFDLAHDGQRWDSARARGFLEGRTPFTLALEADETAAMPGARRFRADTENAGALLQALDLIETVRGGRLEATGTIDPQGTADGLLTIDGFRLVQAPVVARLLSLAALTGILEALTGDGLAFQSLSAPFTLRDDVLTVTDFRANGPSLGLTADGTINLANDALAITGTLVPAYALNSLLGRLPIIGDLLTGFEEGGGVFAASYSVQGPVDRPDIRVNPLSALAPGFLRNLFSNTPPAPAPER